MLCCVGVAVTVVRVDVFRHYTIVIGRDWDGNGMGWDGVRGVWVWVWVWDRVWDWGIAGALGGVSIAITCCSVGIAIREMCLSDVCVMMFTVVRLTLLALTLRLFVM